LAGFGPLVIDSRIDLPGLRAACRVLIWIVGSVF